VDPAQHARAGHHVVAPEEHRSERGADRPDDRPALDLGLRDRQGRAHRQDRQRVEVADVVCDNERDGARHLPTERDLKVVCARHGAERTREPVRRGAQVARWRHAHGAELGECVKQATGDVSGRRDRLHRNLPYRMSPR